MLNAKSSVFCHALRLMAFISSRLVYNSLLGWTLWKLGKCEDQTWWLENSDRPTSCGMEHSHKHNALSLILSLSQVQVKWIQEYTGPEDKHDRTVLPKVITSGNRKVNTCYYCHSRLLGNLKHVINIDRDTDCVCISLWVWACVCVYV